MPSVNFDLISLLAGLLMTAISGLYAAALVFPALGRRMYGRLWPRGFELRSQRRAAYARAIALIGVFLFLGLQSVLHLLKNRVCTAQETLELASLFMPMLAMFCIVLVSIMQRRIGIEQAVVPKKTPTPKLILVLLLVVGVAPLFLAFFLIAGILNETFEPLERVQMVSSNEGWAIGNIVFSGVMYHYQDGVWTKVAIPDTHLLTDISMLSPDEGWAVSDGATMLHYHSGAWTSVPSPARELTGIDMVSADDGWAVGNFGTILHYVQGRWQRVASPTRKTLKSVSMVSANEGWAVGGGDSAAPEAGVILQYHNGVWKLADNLVKAQLSRIQMITPDEGWAVGGSRFNPTQSIILHYQHGEWTQEPSPVDIPLNDISMVSSTEGWAVGGDFFRVPLTCPTSSQSVELNALLHYTNGAWIRMSSPADQALRCVSMIENDTGLIVGWNTFLDYAPGGWKKMQPEP